MDGTRVFVVLIFCLASVTPVFANILDVCASCHDNATCDDKPDNSGKVCNCKYGYVGNGRTFCQDKDECQIGATKICGQHTTCHNTYGSYYCNCLIGYMASNNMPVFIPNDGTHCQDIDECLVEGLCGEGGQCRNLDGSFDCSCHLGYRVQNGTEPFRPGKDQTSCQVVDCGQPTSQQDSVLRSTTGTVFGSMAMFECDQGFRWRSGTNTSQCGADGLWSRTTMICDEILCGNPHKVPHTGHIWNGISTPGSVVNYFCKPGFNQSEGNGVSRCKLDGNWTETNISCKEIDCGSPPEISHAILLWDHITTVGSQVVYQCQSGYYSVGKRNKTVCGDNGDWDTPSFLCQEMQCQDPVFIPNTQRRWDGTSHVGSAVIYECNEGYYARSGRNFSVCGKNGLWGEIDLWCEEITCGPPQILPYTNLLWNNSTKPGSVVLYECMDGFYQDGGDNISTCLTSGEWENVSLNCQAICGPAPLLAHSEIAWQMGSVVTYRCVNGYHWRRGDNVSVCGSSGVWRLATLKCIVPAVPDVHYREYDTSVPTLRLKRTANTLDPISFYQVFVLPVEQMTVFDCSSPMNEESLGKSASSQGQIVAQMRVSHVGPEIEFTVGDGFHYGGFFNAPLEKGRNYYVILRAVSQWKKDSKSLCVLWAKVTGTSYFVTISSLCAAASVGLIALIVLLGLAYTRFFKKT
ncbi:sushi domain-containing protein 1-like isoform X2 [Stigmatopora nigra]